MNKDITFELDKDLIRERLNKYTKKAFSMLPEMDKPRILEVGCGSGVPTIELARLSRGEVIGIDVDQPALDRFTKKIRDLGLSDRVKAVNCSMLNMTFPDESFDIIWSEGSIFIVGFKKGLTEWQRFIKPNGFLVVHDEKGNIEEKINQVSDCGYRLLNHFMLNENTWWAEYFAPLEKLIYEARINYADSLKLRELLHDAQCEIDMFRKNPKLNSSAFLIMQKS